MKAVFAISSVIFAAALVSCASGGVQRGSVAMKISDSTAHVGIGGKEVKVGDHLVLYRNECSGGAGKDTADRTCQKIETGHGEVTQILNNDYSTVTFPAGTKFSEGDTLEKHAH